MKDEMKMKLVLLVLGAGLLGSELFAERQPNPTAPNDKYKFLSGDFTDTDGDGMTDVGELKYGFDPNDADSHPKELYYLDENSTFEEPAVQEIFSENNRFYYKFSDTPEKSETDYRNFFVKMMPILYRKLGPPMETIICTMRGFNRTDFFYSMNYGRKILHSKTRYIPKTMTHEIIHAWKGRYLVGSREKSSSWHYDSNLAGWEEGITDALTYEVLHEYYRMYPNDVESLKNVLRGVYYSNPEYATNYDEVRHVPSTGGGYLVTGEGILTHMRYSIAATTFQLLLNERKTLYRDLMAKFTENINRHPQYRPSVEELTILFRYFVSQVHGTPTRDYMEALPVCQGYRMSDGVYTVYQPRWYGKEFGSRTRVGVTYAIDGTLWWSSTAITEDKNNFDRLPTWIDTILMDGKYYLNVMEQPLEVKVTNVHDELVDTLSFETPTEYSRDINTGKPVRLPLVEIATGYDFPIGLYRKQLDWTNYSPHTSDAVETIRFFGARDYVQNMNEEIAIWVGVDADIVGSVRFEVDGKQYVRELVNGCAILKSRTLPMDLKDEVVINVIAGGIERRYKRFVMDTLSVSNYRQSQFIIIDRDFDGIEDPYDDEVVPVKIEGDYVDVTYEKTPEGLSVRWDDELFDDVYISFNLMHEDRVLFKGGNFEGGAFVDYEALGLNGTEILHMWFKEYVGGKYNKTYTPMRVNLGDFLQAPPSDILDELVEATQEHMELPHDPRRGEPACGCPHIWALGDDVVDDPVLLEEYLLNALPTRADEFDKPLQSTPTEVNATNEPTLASGGDDEYTPNLEATAEAEGDDASLAKSSGKRKSYNTQSVGPSIATNEFEVLREDTILRDTTTGVYDFTDLEANVSPKPVKERGVKAIVLNPTASTVNNYVSHTAVSNDTPSWANDEKKSQVAETEFEVVEVEEESEWTTAEDLGAGWKYVEWFGHYFESNSTKWIYKPCGGWFYLESISYDSAWLWNENLGGWVWTSKDIYPNMYSPTTDWIYVNNDKHCFYDYIKERWISFDDVK